MRRSALAAALALLCLLVQVVVATARNATSAAGSGAVPGPHLLFASIAFPGHLIPLARLASEMRRRGYRVSFATNTPGKRWLRGLDVEFWDLGPFPTPWRELASRLEDVSRDHSSFRGILTLLNEIYLPFSVPTYKALIPLVARDPPDVMVVDVATLGAQDVALRTRVPTVMNSPSIEFSIEVRPPRPRARAAPAHGGAGAAQGPPAYVPAWGTGYRRAMTLWERCMNLIFPRLLSIALTPPFMHLNKVRWEHSIPPHRSQHDLFLHMRVLLNTAAGIDYARPTPPLAEHVGPLLPPDADNATLPRVLRRWLDRGPAVLGVVGHLVQPSDALLRAMVEGAARGGRRVLWSLPPSLLGRAPSPLPEGTRVVRGDGTPPLPALRHRNVRAAAGDCCMRLVQEALAFARPVACVPFYADQLDIAARAEDTGAARAVPKDRLTAAAFDAALSALVDNATVAAAARRARELVRRSGGLRRAADVVESTYAVGHAHLVTADLELPWHRAVMLDVAAVHLAALVMLTAGAYLLYAAAAAAAAALLALLIPDSEAALAAAAAQAEAEEAAVAAAEKAAAAKAAAAKAAAAKAAAERGAAAQAGAEAAASPETQPAA